MDQTARRLIETNTGEQQMDWAAQADTKVHERQS